VGLIPKKKKACFVDVYLLGGMMTFAAVSCTALQNPCSLFSSLVLISGADLVHVQSTTIIKGL
jgi:hypothetical protein